MSSRNAYLTPDQRRDAVGLSRALFAARELWERGERDPRVLRERVEKLARSDNVALEYVSVADPLTLAELDAPTEAAVISLAARVGKARLIDNVLLGMKIEEIA
jgi:pantoate--beta-alanine ligase